MMVTSLPLHSKVIFETVVASQFRLPSVLVSSCHDAGTLLAEESCLPSACSPSEQTTLQTKLHLDK